MLSELLQGTSFPGKFRDVRVNGLATDSRKVVKGDLFFALSGEHHDGNMFVRNAIDRGAVAVITGEREPGENGIPVIPVPDINDTMAMMSARFYGNPSRKMKLVGITGTNGKTTTSYILRKIFREAGLRTGITGTISYIIGDRSFRARLTTPLAVDFQRILKDMYEEGVTHVVSEVSSHALGLKRVDYTDFDVSVFTNLTRDHLDFHGTMEDYFRAKLRLFRELTHKAGIINIDDPYGRRISEEISVAGLRVTTFGLSGAAVLRAVDVYEDERGIRFSIPLDGRALEVSSPLLGKTNVYNILAAVGVSLVLDIDEEVIRRGIEGFQGVEGRMESVRMDREFMGVIDYAHTPDALQRVLKSLRGFTRGRIITVFGCGGDRDRGKRPEMGRIASQLSDLVIVTSDNPRSERPEDIIAGILEGVRKDNCTVVTDRREAIFRAVDIARKDDTILVAGKGHEDYQEIEGVRYPFKDREVLKEALDGLSRLSG
ncbi:UDP-N-acetylmuramoyl-L-alanyl-D-glutamate--2, 6-diaminopimelate ligase [bacterium BMS3Bbin06]|nr:UDP-N-acetylmuramoyl-L-alanyl-D-glutamate--2, 6-diaminopimelate ligase [bacterium BMS3Abin08]GBE34356.1 UDP-N-acetylmuramoyl-L-alanyl-D-glutamate--2, 6-diaminopimelate ligase [bacterium BMS3Bbin06]HDO34794.1 UDP-N-acetylmuramoyl-L-alanyl-D-glutamate--2,6-diaminopimelate ligase [Nitrospirota bacterium]